MKLSTVVIHSSAKAVGLAQDYARCLTRAIRSTLAGEPERIARWRCLVLMGVLCVIGTTTANGSQYNKDQLRLYAHSRIIIYSEFVCFNKIITKESRWSYTAKNGSHYGLGQMRSTWYRDLDPYRQIDQTLRYITKRYQTPCAAWLYHGKHGWY